MANVEVLRLEPGNTYLFSDAENGLIQANVAKAIREQVEAGLQHIAEINRPKLIVLSNDTSRKDEPRVGYPPIYGVWVGESTDGVNAYVDGPQGKIVLGYHVASQKCSPFSVVINWDGTLSLQVAADGNPAEARHYPIAHDEFGKRLAVFIDSFADLVPKPESDPAPESAPEATTPLETSQEPEVSNQSVESNPADATDPE